MSAPAVYRAFGLRIASEIALPELPFDPLDDGQDADVAIRRGRVPPSLVGARLPHPAIQVTDADVLITVDPGRYLITAGRTIWVDAAPDASGRDLRLHLLGTALGALLHQRAILPLHANAIDLGRVAIAIAGPAGAGKSSLAAAFQARGRAVLCDDVCAVRFEAGEAVALPGIARIKLWRDTLEGLAIDRAGLERVADGMDKYSLPTPAATIRRALPLTRLYVLSDQPASAATFAPLTGAAAMSAVIGNIYRWPLAQAMGMAKAQFDACVALLGRCAVFELAAPRGLSGLDAIAEAVERHALGAARLGDDLPLALEGL